MIKDLAPSGYMRYASEGHFTFATFASAFLIKVRITVVVVAVVCLSMLSVLVTQAGVR